MRNEIKAYFTLEATLVLPFIFIIMIWLVEIGVYQYNRCILTQEVYKIMLEESSNFFISKEQAHDNLLQRKKLIEWGKLIGIGAVQTKINVTNSSMKIEIIAEQHQPIRLPFKIGDWIVDVSVESNRNNPLVILRRSKLLQDIKNGD